MQEKTKEGQRGNRIVMINSFKGGAGKTTAALCRCISEYRDVSDHNIYYVDLDILGTGVEYVLSLGKQAAYYNDPDGDRKLEENVQEIMGEEKNGNCLYAAVLNPVSRIKQTYGGQDRLRSHPDVEQGVFREKVKTLIDQILDSRPDNLIVMDCAPGVSYMEERILEDLYQMKGNPQKRLSVEEIFVTTPDAAHIRKTVSSLNACAPYLLQHKQAVTILVNDVFNCEGISRKGREEGRDDFVYDRRMIETYLKEELKLDPPVKVLYQPYREELLKRNILRNEKILKNKPDDYDVWPREQE